jgi:methylglutaconyl-CoA hydratase
MFYLKEIDNRGVATVTLNRPELHNAFNDEFIDQLIKCFEELSNDLSVRLVVLTGAGKSFCAGADLNWMKKMKDYSDEENYRDSVELAKLFETIESCPVPVIAKVNGAALGGGTGLIAACDYAICCQSAKIGFTEVNLGLVPAVISPFVISRIGVNNARAYFLSGERFMGETAKHIGLVHSVCPLDDLDSQTEKLMTRFLGAGPNAAKEAKALVFGVAQRWSEGRESLRDYTCKTISRVRVSDEGQEGMAALLEKRKPNWLGN